MERNPSPAPAPAHPAPGQPSKWRKRRLAWVAAAAGVLALLAVAFVLLVLFTEWGARFAWQTASRMLPGQLSGELAGGTLADGLALRNVVYEDETKQVRIDRLDAAWTLTRSPLLLTIAYLRLGKVDIAQRRSPPEPSTPPREIRLPLAIDLQSATVQQLAIHREDATQSFSDILLRAGSDGVQHTLSLERAQTPYGKVSAFLRLNGLPPFALDGTAGLDTVFHEKPFELDARLSGSLREPRIRLDAAGAGLTARASIEATPYAPVPLRRAEIHARAVDPRVFNPAWPQADLDIDAELAPVEGGKTLTVAGPVSIANRRPGAIDKGLLPVVAARARAVMDTARQQLADLSVTLTGGASLAGSAELRGPDQGELMLQAGGIDMHALHTRLQRSRLAGPLTAKLAGDTQQASLQLADDKYSMHAEAALDPRQVTLHTARLEAGKARLEASGTLAREGESAYDLTGTLSGFNPALFFSSPPARGKRAWKVPEAHINMQFNAQGMLRPELRAAVDFRIRDSTYAGLPMTGRGTLRVAGGELLPSDAQLAIAGNRVALKGAFGAPSDRLHVAIDAPALAGLGFGLSGLLRVDGNIAGTPDRPVVDATYHAENLAFGPHRIARLAGEAHLRGLPGSAPDARLMLTLKASGVQSIGVQLSRLDAAVNGTYARHTIDTSAAGTLRGRPLDARIAAQGRLRELRQGLAWDGVLNTLQNAGFPRLSMADPLPLRIAPGAVELGATRLTLEGANVDLQGFRYTGGRIRTEGAFRALRIADLLELRRQLVGAAPPVGTDLVLDGRWALTLADTASGFAQVERRSGDISLPPGKGSRGIGLRVLSVRADLQGDAVALDAHAEAARMGKLDAQGRIALRQADGRLSLAPDAPVSGHVEALIPRLQALGFLADPNIAFEGRASVNLDIGGTLADPRLSGTAAGDGLALTLYDQGVRMRDGVARLALQDNVAELQRLEFHSGGGTLRATGQLPLDSAARELRATIIADNFQLLSNPSAQLSLSGQAQVTTVDRQPLLTGKFAVDRALFNLPEKTPPKLGDDVVIIRNGKRVDVTGAEEDIVPEGEQPSGPLSPRINVEVDLGDDFRFEGSGADLRLAGALEIRSAPGETPRAFGTVRVVDGTYEAFGAELAIERGVINFQGPFNNPNVNILAMRRGQEVAAGVSVSGTAQRPRVQLVSEPNVPDEEKLSWLVFGSRGGGAAGPGQAQAAAKGAALGLLNKFGGERLASGFGLDEFSIGESAFGLAGQQVVNLGKEISDRLFIGYEQSLAGAESVLKLTYELTQSWSVVLRGGAVTGIEVFFSKRFDSLR